MLFSKKQALLLLAVFCLLLGIATVADLSLSKAIVNEASLFGKIMEVVGEAPALFFAAFCVGILFARFLTAKKLPACIGLTLLCIGCCYYPVHATSDYLCEYGLTATPLPLWAELLLSVAFAAILLLLAIRFYRTLEEARQKSACRIALTVICTALCVLAGILFLKFFFGRIRFRQLVALGDFSLYTPWFIPHPFRNSSYVSFPSGHTANACVIFLASLFFPRNQRAVRILLFGWIALCAFSRIRVGAHFLSDVVFSAAFCLTLCALWCRKYKVTQDSFL